MKNSHKTVELFFNNDNTVTQLIVSMGIIVNNYLQVSHLMGDGNVCILYISRNVIVNWVLHLHAQLKCNLSKSQT